MIKDTTIYITSAAAIALSAIIGMSVFHINDRNLMSKNISEAVAKGMDPLTVRCAFANSSDTICVAYAASGKK